MVSQVTLSIVKDENKKQNYTIMTQNEKFINSIITVGKDNTITEEDFQKLQATAKRAGDASVLEYVDLCPQEKINMAKLTNKYGNKYNIELITENGKQFYKFTIKERYLHVMLGCFGGPSRSLQANNIESDFQLDKKYSHDDVWAHDMGQCTALTKFNEDLWDKTGNIKYNREFKAGTTFKLPVEDVTFDF